MNLKPATLLALALLALPLVPPASAYADLSDCVSYSDNTVTYSADGCVGLVAAPPPSTTGATARVTGTTNGLAGCTVYPYWQVRGTSAAHTYTWDARVTVVTSDGQSGMGQPGSFTRTIPAGTVYFLVPGQVLRVVAVVSNEQAPRDTAHDEAVFACLPFVIRP